MFHISFAAVLFIVFLVVVLGVIAWLVSIAPFIEAKFKSFAIWFLIALAACIVIIFIWGILKGGFSYITIG